MQARRTFRGDIFLQRGDTMAEVEKFPVKNLKSLIKISIFQRSFTGMKSFFFVIIRYFLMALRIILPGMT